MNEKLFITRKRKKYKFAKFNEFENCFQIDEWQKHSFDFDEEVVLEVGAGTGLFSVEMARLHPEKYYIVVDIKSDRLYTGAKLACELSLNNIIFVRSEISRFVETLPKNRISEVWVTFPDPHANEDQTRLTSTGDRKRLTAQKFTNEYKRALKVNGRLFFKTDNMPLFDWSVEQFKNNGWKINFETRDLHDSDCEGDERIMTTYEKRFVEEGLPIFYLSATIEK